MKRLLPLALLVAIAAIGLALRPGTGGASAPGPDASSVADAAEDAADAAPIPAGPDASEAGADASSPSELDSMVRLRAAVDAHPEEALALAAEAERLFPSGRFADERALLSMRALVHLERITEARDAAAAFHRRFPDSPWAEQVVRLTGYQPRRYGPRR